MIEAFDYAILELFQQIHADALTVLFRFFTWIGEGGAVWIIAGMVLFAHKDKRKHGIIVLLSLFFCLIFVNGALKNAVVRPRPCWRHTDIEMLIAVPTDFSFPSGHTASSFAAAVSVGYWNKKYGVAAIALACCIAASRLYFFVHYPTDIVAGAICGSLMAVLSIAVVEAVLAKRKKGNIRV